MYAVLGDSKCLLHCFVTSGREKKFHGRPGGSARFHCIMYIVGSGCGGGGPHRRRIESCVFPAHTGWGGRRSTRPPTTVPTSMSRPHHGIENAGSSSSSSAEPPSLDSGSSHIASTAAGAPGLPAVCCAYSIGEITSSNEEQPEARNRSSTPVVRGTS